MICRYERTIFKSSDGFCIFLYVTEDQTVPMEARRNSYQSSKKIHFSAIGHHLPETDTVEVDLDGKWQQSSYGVQLSVEKCEQKLPTDNKGIVAYLSSGFIKGIGPETAKAIVARFGSRTLEVMENDPQQLLTIKGIKQGKLQKIIDSYEKTRKLGALTAFLAPYDVSEKKIMSLYLDVKYRLLWFRLHRPNGKIDSEIIHVDDKSAVVCCKLYADRGDALDQYVAKSSAQRFVTQERFGDRYLETAETAAMGRVLAAAGYGTQFCGAADMFGDIMVDAPVDLGAVEEDCSEEPGVASQVKHETKQTGTAQTAATVSMPQPAPATAPAPAAAPKKQEPVTLEDYLNSMTLEEAKNVRIDVGYYKGNTLGELALRKPSDLEWYVKNYSGRNLALKAGAILLVDAASKMAS